jgi:hypothetical protein
MKTVYKYDLKIEDLNHLALPHGAKFLMVDRQMGRNYAWFEVPIVSDQACMKLRHFKVFGTGHEIPDDAQWLATWQAEPFVWHLYEVKS